jgi:hypothetical protein
VRALAAALALTLAVDQWSQRIVLMACWGPSGSDSDISMSCSTVANQVSYCRAKADSAPDEFSMDVFFNCMEYQQ